MVELQHTHQGLKFANLSSDWGEEAIGKGLLL